MKKVLKFNWFLLYKSEHQKVCCFKAKRKKLETICNIIQVLKQKVKIENIKNKYGVQQVSGERKTMKKHWFSLYNKNDH